jgi:hypothetical protein
MAEEIEGEVIGIGTQEGPGFSIHFDVDSKYLGQLFQDRFFNWIRKGLVQPRHERPPFQVPQAHDIPIPLHVSLQPEVPENDGW